jgi:hypothetical protein
MLRTRYPSEQRQQIECELTEIQRAEAASPQEYETASNLGIASNDANVLCRTKLYRHREKDG